MTTIAVFEAKDLSGALLDAEVGVISDSRTATAGIVLTDTCHKLLEIDLRCDLRKDIFSATDRIAKKNYVLACAGSTIVAHNVAFAALASLRALVGPSEPSIDDVAEFIARLATSLTREVGALIGDKAKCEFALIAYEDGSFVGRKVRPEVGGELTYLVQPIGNLPFLMGGGARFFTAEELSMQPSGQAFLRLFERELRERADANTGGELQMIVLGGSGVRRVQPMRWINAEEKYVANFFGIDTYSPSVGPCRIGIVPWQFEDR